MTPSPPADAVAEAFRHLRTALLSSGASPRRIVATGAETGVPTSEVVEQLARALAGAGGRVVAIDCDLRDPQLHRRFGLDNKTGLAELLRDGSEPLLQQVTAPGGALYLLAAGQPSAGVAELIASDRFGGLLDLLLQTADYLVLSTPPVTAATDAALAAARADAVILILEAGRTSREAGQRAVKLLNQVNAPLIGAVLTGSG